MDNLTQIKEKILSLQEALLDQHPQLPTILRDIHTKLKLDPETVTLLNDEEVAIIVSGLKKQTQTHIVTTASKSKASKALKSLDLGDL